MLDVRIIFFFYYIYSVISVEVLTVLEHTLTGHHVDSITGEFSIDILYADPRDWDVAYVWTRVTCDVTMDIYRVIPCRPTDPFTCADSLDEFWLDFPVDQTRTSEIPFNNVSISTTNSYRAMMFNKKDCHDHHDCRFRLMMTANSMSSCELTFKIERGLTLTRHVSQHFNESGQPPHRSFNQLYSIYPIQTNDFPLYVRVDTADSSRVVLQHSWGYSTTVYQSYHDGSFEVQIPMSDKFRANDYFFVWISVLDSSPYDVTMGPAPETTTSLFFFDMSPYILLFCLLGLLLLACICYHLIPSPYEEDPYAMAAPPPVTKEELETFDVVTWKGASDDPEELNKCTICLEEFEVGEELRKLTCSHCFHKECVDYWLLQHQRRCPLCMQDVNEAVNYHERDDSITVSYYTYQDKEIPTSE